MTFDDLKSYLQLAHQYKETHKDTFHIFINYSIYSPVNEIFTSLVLSELGDINASKPDINKSLAAVKKTLQAFEEIAKYNVLDSTFKQKYTQENDPILQGKILFAQGPSSLFNQWEAVSSSDAQNIAPSEFPVFEKPGMYYHGSFQSVWAILKNAPHKEEAISLMKFFSSNDFAERWLSITKNPTALKVKLNATDLGQDDIEYFNREIEKKYGYHIQNYDIVKILFGSNSEFKIDPSPVVNGTMTAEQYYNVIVKQLHKK